MHFEQKTICNERTVLDKDGFWMKHFEHFNSTEVFKKSISTTKTRVLVLVDPPSPLPWFCKRLLDNFFWQFLSLNPLNCVVECGLLWCACSSGNWPNFSNWTIHIWPVWPHGSNMKKGFTLKEQNREIRDISNVKAQIWPSFFNNALKLVGGRTAWFKINAYPLFLDTLASQVSTTVSQ